MGVLDSHSVNQAICIVTLFLFLCNMSAAAKCWSLFAWPEKEFQVTSVTSDLDPCFQKN